MADKKEEKKEAAPDGKGGKKKLIIIIAAALVVLLAAGAGGWFLLKKKAPPPEEKKDPGKEVPVPDLHQKSDIGPMIEIKEFIVNIISQEGSHYVKAALTVELSSEAAKEEVNQRMPQIRDAILLLVGNKSFEELQDLQGKKQLKAEMTSKINAVLKSGKVKSIYFTDFVVQ